MRPEIYALVRQTYPDLTNAPSTKRPLNLRGFQNNLIFVNHESLEQELSEKREEEDRGHFKRRSGKRIYIFSSHYIHIHIIMASLLRKSLLPPGSQTSHSRLCIPLNLHEKLTMQY